MHKRILRQTCTAIENSQPHALLVRSDFNDDVVEVGAAFSTFWRSFGDAVFEGVGEELVENEPHGDRRVQGDMDGRCLDA